MVSLWVCPTFSSLQSHRLKCGPNKSWLFVKPRVSCIKDSLYILMPWNIGWCESYILSAIGLKSSFSSRCTLSNAKSLGWRSSIKKNITINRNLPHIKTSIYGYYFPSTIWWRKKTFAQWSILTRMKPLANIFITYSSLYLLLSFISIALMQQYFFKPWFMHNDL